MRILALDLGTHCGWARSGGAAGTWELATPKEITAWGKQRLTRRCDPRIVRLYKKLSPLATELDLVIFEDVEFTTYTQQTQLWSSFRGAVWCAFCGDVGIDCVPVGTLKKFATGHGGATKEMMAAALYRQFPELKEKGYDDNAVDAIFLLRWAEKNLCRMTPSQR